jgi:hypothetical protein
LGIAPLGPTELLKLLPEGGDVKLRFEITLLDGKEQTDSSHPLGQLRARTERSAARKSDRCRNKIPAIHSTTSSRRR